MNQHFRQRPFQSGNPLANILVVIAGIFVISLSLTLGFFIFLGVATFLLVTAAIVGVRNWWFRRSVNAESTANRPRQDEKEECRQIIEGEFREIRSVHEDRNKP